MQLRVSPRGDRLIVVEHEPAVDGGGEMPRDRGEMARGGGEMTLEIVMLAAVRHAFPIHHWRPRPWQAPLASLVLEHFGSRGDNQLAQAARADSAPPPLRTSAMGAGVINSSPPPLRTSAMGAGVINSSPPPLRTSARRTA